MCTLPTLFPDFTEEYFLSFQFSSWYPKFSGISVKSTIICPIDDAFREYLHSDGVFVPDGSEDLPVSSTLSDSEDDETLEDVQEESSRKYAFPELDAKIRQTIKEYGAVFPKLNFSSPKDASWILPASSPLKCTSPSEVYLLLKSSDFIAHDLDEDAVYAGCESKGSNTRYELELVLRKWYPIDRSRELRCFVRGDRLIGISQRDMNFYEFLNDSSTQEVIISTILRFWERNVREKHTTSKDYTFDLLLTRDLSRVHILDFNPYAPRTDPLLFTYEELLALISNKESDLPKLKVIDSRAHPEANRNAPAYQHNMVPFEVLSLGSGRDIQEFTDLWQQEIAKSSELE